MGFKLEHSLTSENTDPKKDWLSEILQKEVTFFGKAFGNKKKEDFYSELGVLLKAGIHLKEALTLIQENQKKEKLKTFYGDMVQGL
ncbi:MAG: type II secretion system F family protein, partial [Bacteroidota bacterium]